MDARQAVGSGPKQLLSRETKTDGPWTTTTEIYGPAVTQPIHDDELHRIARAAGAGDAAAYAARQAQDGPHSAMINQAMGSVMAQQSSATGKMFSRVEILTVLRSRKAVLVGRPHFDEACRELDILIDIFERME